MGISMAGCDEIFPRLQVRDFDGYGPAGDDPQASGVANMYRHGDIHVAAAQSRGLAIEALCSRYEIQCLFVRCHFESWYSLSQEPSSPAIGRLWPCEISTGSVSCMKRKSDRISSEGVSPSRNLRNELHVFMYFYETPHPAGPDPVD
nr:hypothetical protein CFP56_09662 [Quercus suber]